MKRKFPEYDARKDGNVFAWIIEASKQMRAGLEYDALAERIKRREAAAEARKQEAVTQKRGAAKH